MNETVTFVGDGMGGEDLYHRQKLFYFTIADF